MENNDTDPVRVKVDKCGQNEIKFKLEWDQIHSNLSRSKLLENEAEAVKEVKKEEIDREEERKKEKGIGVVESIAIQTTI